MAPAVLPVDTRDLWEQRPVAVTAQLALLGSPIGLLGGNIDFAPSRHLVLTAGAGVGGGEAAALQVSLMARMRWTLREEAAFSIGLGLSGGGYRPVLQGFFKEGNYDQSVWERALWVNVEAGPEIRPRPLPGLVFRLALGLSNMLNPGDERCQRVSEGKLTGPVGECSYKPRSDGFWSRMRLPYVGLAVGYAFSL